MKTSAKKSSRKKGNANGAAAEQPGVQMVKTKVIQPNPLNPRKSWDNQKDDEGKTPLARLADNIHQNGLLSPLVTTPRNSHHLIVCGERRFRAISKFLNWVEIPCIVRDGMTDGEIIETAISENLMREDVSAIDQARAYHTLLEKKVHTRKSLAKKLGISEAAISYKLSLLGLTPELQKQIDQGKLTETHGRKIVQTVNRIKGNGKKAESQRQQAMERINTEVIRASSNNGGKTLDTSTVEQVTQKAVNDVAGQEVKSPARRNRRAAPSTPKPSKKPSGKPPLSKAKAREIAQAVLTLIAKHNRSMAKLKTTLTHEGKRWQVAVELAKAQSAMGQFIYESFQEIALLHRAVCSAESEPEVKKAHKQARSKPPTKKSKKPPARIKSKKSSQRKKQ